MFLVICIVMSRWIHFVKLIHNKLSDFHNFLNTAKSYYAIFRFYKLYAKFAKIYLEESNVRAGRMRVRK